MSIAWHGEPLTPKRYAARLLKIQIGPQPEDWLDSLDPDRAAMTPREVDAVAAQLTTYRDRILALLGE